MEGHKGFRYAPLGDGLFEAVRGNMALGPFRTMSEARAGIDAHLGETE